MVYRILPNLLRIDTVSISSLLQRSATPNQVQNTGANELQDRVSPEQQICGSTQPNKV